MISYIFGLVILYVIVFVIILPYLKLRHYKKQGAVSIFFPGLGGIGKYFANAERKGDYYYFQKRIFNENPNARLLAFNLGGDINLSLLDTKLIKAFYSNQNLYVKQRGILGFVNDLLGNGLITSDGAIHKRHRKIISNVFHFELLRSFIPSIVRSTKNRFDIIEKEGLKNVKVMQEFQNITGEVVGEIFFGEDLNKYTFDGKPLTIALADLLADTTKAALTLSNFLLGPDILRHSPFPGHKRVLNNINRFRDICLKIVTEKKEQYLKNKGKPKERKDMLDHLFESVEACPEEDTLTEKDIVDEFITFFLAGMDTTGHLVAMATYFLTQHPEHLPALRKEVDNIYKDGENLTPEILQKMEFMTAVLKESLRHATPASNLFPRVATQDHQLLDVTIKKGTVMNVEFMALNFSEQNFENPHAFDPYRFIKKPTLEDPFAFIPFSAGSRNCIGQHLAMIEGRIILSEFLKRYDFSLRDGYEMKMTIKFLYEPKHELQMNLTRRV